VQCSSILDRKKLNLKLFNEVMVQTGIFFICLLNCGKPIKVVTDSALLTPAENVALVQCVERETLTLAKSNGFHCIFTSNSSPLTQVNLSTNFIRKQHF